MKKRDLLAFLLVIIGVFGFSVKSQAAPDVNNWDAFGVNERDYNLNISRPYLAQQAAGRDEIDLRKSVVPITYIGENITNDLFLNSTNLKDEKERLLMPGDLVTIKKMGSYKGRYLEVQIRVAIRMLLTANLTNKLPMLNWSTYNVDNNAGGKDTQLTMTIHYQDTGEVVKLETGKYFLFNASTRSGWNIYTNATLVPSSTKVIVGNRTEDQITLKKMVTYYDYELGLYKLATGKVDATKDFYFSFLIPSGRPFYYGIQGFAGLVNLKIIMFDPVGTPVAVPASYNNVNVKTTLRVNKKDMNHQVTVQLPIQTDDSFFPDNLRLNLGYHATDYSQGTPQIVRKDTNTTIGSSEYSYNAEVLSLPKAFLKKYQGQTILINYVTTIDYSSPRILQEYFNQGTKKFSLPYSIQVLADFTSFNREDFSLAKTDTLTYPLELTGTKINSQVDVGKTTTDYPIETFLKDIKSNFPDDTVKASMPLIAFTQKGSVEIPITLESTKLGIKKIITVTTQAIDTKFEFKQVPTSISLDLNLGSREAYPVLDQELSITDNRKTAKWKIGATISKVVNAENAKELNGSFYYKNVDGAVEIQPETKTTIVTGNSPTDGTDTVSISNTWDKSNGLYYQTENVSNYGGLYQGNITWVLEDTPE